MRPSLISGYSRRTSAAASRPTCTSCSGVYLFLGGVIRVCAPTMAVHSANTSAGRSAAQPFRSNPRPLMAVLLAGMPAAIVPASNASSPTTHGRHVPCCGNRSRPRNLSRGRHAAHVDTDRDTFSGWSGDTGAVRLDGTVEPGATAGRCPIRGVTCVRAWRQRTGRPGTRAPGSRRRPDLPAGQAAQRRAGDRSRDARSRRAHRSLHPADQRSQLQRDACRRAGG